MVVMPGHRHDQPTVAHGSRFMASFRTRYSLGFPIDRANPRLPPCATATIFEWSYTLLMNRSRTPRTISATEFKAHCLALMDEVQRTGEELIVTKHGKPVARVGPMPSTTQSPLLGWMRGTSEVTGDLIGAEDVWHHETLADPARRRRKR